MLESYSGRSEEGKYLEEVIQVEQMPGPTPLGIALIFISTFCKHFLKEKSYIVTFEGSVAVKSP